MIKEIHLQNFQAHKDTVMELHPGLNVVAGSSNSGKSSVLRAINWAIYNRPSGDAFVSHWARDAKGNQKEDTSVSIVTNSTTITRKKSKATGNTYAVNDKVLEAIGLDVPEEVATAFNLTEVNTQRQHDAPFLLSESPGDVAKFFNKIVHFDAIDKYLSSIESKKRKTKAEGLHADENAKRLNEELSQYDWLDKAEKLIQAIADEEKELGYLTTKYASLHKTYTDYVSIHDQLPEIKKVLSASAKLITSIGAQLISKGEWEGKIPPLKNSIASYKGNTVTLEATEELDFAEKLIRRIDKQVAMRNDLSERIELIENSILRHKQFQTIVFSANTDIPDLEKQLPSVCPLCGKEL